MGQNVEGIGTFKNQPAYDKEGNFIGWVSRSMACLNVVFCCDRNDKLYVLACQRGTGTPDPELVGKWNCTVGYLDYNETTKEAACRETYEETGIVINPDSDIIALMSINDDPKKDKRQNVTFRYSTLLCNNIENYVFNKSNNEQNEVGEIKWIPVEDIDDYKWAFNHENIIKEMLATGLVTI